jgi:hypothetical protein
MGRTLTDLQAILRTRFILRTRLTHLIRIIRHTRRTDPVMGGTTVDPERPQSRPPLALSVELDSCNLV